MESRSRKFMRLLKVMKSIGIIWQPFGTHLSEMEKKSGCDADRRFDGYFKDAREYGSILNVDACGVGCAGKICR